MLPLSLYIHTPWCIQKCPYCDFNSHKSPQKLPEMHYVHALLADLDDDLQTFPARPIHSIFIGGGTPSLLSEHAYAVLFEGLRKRLIFTPHIEITLEANPGSVEQTRFKAYRALGINRLSIGIQSFNKAHLKALGRIHDDEEAHRAILSAREAGFDNINLDLMHGLPEQSVSEGMQDLKTALAYTPEHLSWYQLTLEPNTVFYKKPPKLPSEEITADLEQAGLDYLKANQYERYEISAFSKHQKQAQHNLNYWHFGDYYGIGAGAHGKLTSPDFKSIVRTRKQRQPKDYLNADKSYLVENKQINSAHLLFEFMLNTTRLQHAIPYALFTKQTGLDIKQLIPLLKTAEEKGFITCTQTHWKVTAFGRRFTNDLQHLFLL
ncbi:MAG: radical SAM family heme chaperone HemW [Gammaproteobacteria bacterium]|nr:radical SAM family heme chaperone HemW [Gammaproteobacteria bacterium]MCH9716069.1 radical SAM family heme chaperone HemW [Gammaproteobacteria bacterium]MCH9763414.1 radical SAM family heme chaperone HemW [Gammaproteobacteria bacterium]